MMNDKAWITATIAHEATGAVPYNVMLAPPAIARMCAHYGAASAKALPEVLGLPMRFISPHSPKPLYADPDVFGPTVTDEFGVVWSTNYIDRGAPLVYALPEANLTGYTFPDPADPTRFAGIAAWCAEHTAHYTVLMAGALWERATFMRSMEDLLLDVALNREFVEDLLDHLLAHILRTMEIAATLGPFDCYGLSDDYGTQKSLLMSPATWRELIKPRLQQIIALANRQGRQTFLHSCGCVEAVVPDLIDIGLDILHPIQPETMDIAALKREYGRDLTFCGGVPTQDLLPFGTPADVRAEVRRLKQVMGEGSGYILEPGITIQDDVPVENIAALIEEART